jgi:hypothetical protein
MDLNKLTKAELINKLTKAELQKGKLEPKIEKLESKNEKLESGKKSALFYEILSKIKNLILSLTIVAFLMRIFKNYKTIRVVLKTANYIILTIFGISIFDAFGLSFITKFLGELKYIFVGIATYLTETTFYNFLMNLFNVTSEKESVRSSYKKPTEIDWKAEFEKAERKREIEEWKNKYNLGKESKLENENENRSRIISIATILLLLGGTATIWYYGADIVSAVSPYWNIGNLIRRILRGGDDEDNGGGAIGPIFLAPKEEEDGRMSPDMLVYSFEQVDQTPKASSSKLPPAPPAPPAPEIPEIPRTGTGMPEELRKNKPESLMSAINKGKRKYLKHVETVIKDNSARGIEVTKHDKNLASSLSEQLDKMRGVVSDSADEIVDECWDNSGIVQSKDDIKSEIVQPKDSIESRTKRSKFLDAISSGAKDPRPERTDVPSVLKPILKQFPNLSEETIKKLSTAEGLRNRAAIIQDLPFEETKITPSSLIDNADKAWKEIYQMNEQETSEMDKIIKSTLNLDSEKVVEKLQEKFPDVKFDVNKYSQIFMKATEEEINSGKTFEEREAIRKEIQAIDLLEIEKTGGTSDIKEIRNVIRENYTHNSLLNEIKNRSSFIDESNNTPSSSINPSDLQSELKDIESVYDLYEKDYGKFKKLIAKVRVDDLIENLKTSENKILADELVTKSVDITIMKMMDENPNLNKQQLIEKLIQDNPLNKDQILSNVTQNTDNQLALWKERMSQENFEKAKRLLTIEDLREREILSGNRTVDQIKTLRSVNKSHSNLLQDLKNKASSMSLKKEKSVDNTSSSTEHLDNTMDLFD